MRLDYNVLCIDDDIESLADYKRQLAGFNLSVGIETNFSDVWVRPTARETNPEPYKQRIFEEIRSRFASTQFDLIMVDLHLGAADSEMGFKGHEIIQFIRDSQTMYRPIVFYSGGEPEGDGVAIGQLQDDIQDNGLVGKCIFLSSRGAELNKDLIGICREMHAEEHKLNASRGLLMDRSSELDAKVLKHLRNKEVWSDFPDSKATKLQREILSELRRQRKNALRKACKMRELESAGVPEFIDWFCGSDAEEVIKTLDSFGRNTLLRELLRVHPEKQENGVTHSAYFKTVGGQRPLSDIRNEYAHQTEAEIGASHNDERCKFIRDELRKHLRNMEVVAGNI